MAFREGQPAGWLGAGPQGLPEERAHAPQMPMRSRAPVGSYPEPDVEEVGPNNPSGIWHSAQVANFMKTVLLYVFMHTNAAVASGIQSLMKERRDLHGTVKTGFPFLDEEEEDLSPPPLDEEEKLVSRGYPYAVGPPTSFVGNLPVRAAEDNVAFVLMNKFCFLREEEEKEEEEEEEEKKAKANARHNHSD